MCGSDASIRMKGPRQPVSSGQKSNRPVVAAGRFKVLPGGSYDQRPRIHEQKKIESFEQINSIRVPDESFDSCNSCKRLGTSRLHESHVSKLPFVSRIEFIRSKLPVFFCSCIRAQSPVGPRGKPERWRLKLESVQADFADEDVGCVVMKV